MHRIRTLLIALMLSALSGALLPMAAVTQAAQALAPAVVLTGTLVARPAGLTPPVSLLLQVGSHTVLVRVTDQTQLLERDDAPVSLGELRDGATLRVRGHVEDDQQLVATVVRDLALPEVITVQVRGQLAAPPSSRLLCLANAVIQEVRPRAAQASVVPPCPAGQLPLSLTSNAKLENRAGERVALADLRVGDSLLATAALLSGHLQAAVVRDLSLLDVPTVQVQGQLAATPSPVTTPPSGLLCLANAVIQEVRPRAAQASVVPPCPAGQLPLSLTSSTRIVNHLSVPISMAALRQGDRLTATALLSNGQLRALWVKDRSV